MAAQRRVESTQPLGIPFRQPFIARPNHVLAHDRHRKSTFGRLPEGWSVKRLFRFVHEVGGHDQDCGLADIRRRRAARRPGLAEPHHRLALLLPLHHLGCGTADHEWAVALQADREGFARGHDRDHAHARLDDRLVPLGDHAAHAERLKPLHLVRAAQAPVRHDDDLLSHLLKLDQRLAHARERLDAVVQRTVRIEHKDVVGVRQLAQPGDGRRRRARLRAARGVRSLGHGGVDGGSHASRALARIRTRRWRRRYRRRAEAGCRAVRRGVGGVVRLAVERAPSRRRARRYGRAGVAASRGTFCAVGVPGDGWPRVERLGRVELRGRHRDQEEPCRG
mmetsp:Transcript_8082/g.17090  ORF Transcript_8082/g.17090 Transcript_8082/m.17090 type:complete len:336 (-) Transcript_8082:69-1076(-)